MPTQLEIGGQGLVGVAFETAIGTYIAPTKWIPIRSESFRVIDEKKYRTNIRGLADRTPGVRGNANVEGDISFEVTRDNLIYFLYAARCAIAKVGAVAPFTYTFTPVHVAKPTTATGPTTRKTLSILVARAGRGFGYVGCSVVGMNFSFEDEVLIATMTLMGLNEGTQTIGAATFGTEGPFGPEHNQAEIPAATARTDTTGIAININEGGEARHRIDANRFASGIRWGEREVTFSAEHDFESDADYDAFIAQTIQSLLINCVRVAASDAVKITVRGAISDSFDSSLSSIGDLVAASVEYHGTNSAADVYEIEIKTNVDIL